MKKFISLFLVFSILFLSWNVFARERKGADLIIQKTDGTQVRGELIAVKEDSLLLLERESGADVTIEIVDTKAITVKKRHVLEWTAAGLVGGTLGGFLIGQSLESPYDPNGWNFFRGYPTAVGTIVGSAIGLVIGIVVGISIKGAKTIQIKGKSKSMTQEIFEDLRKKARVKNAQ
jgi:hypothetical protein